MHFFLPFSPAPTSCEMIQFLVDRNPNAANNGIADWSINQNLDDEKLDYHNENNKHDSSKYEGHYCYFPF